jgi:hypothetical protein
MKIKGHPDPCEHLSGAFLSSLDREIAAEQLGETAPSSTDDRDPEEAEAFPYEVKGHAGGNPGVRTGVDKPLLDFADRNGLYITSGKSGKHNIGSKHYTGHAIDFRTIGMTEAFFQHLVRDAKQSGLILRDERKRPPGQKVWAGPHGHLETP